MKGTFLEYVAKDLLAKYGNDLSQVAVVFPNKRASIFLNDYLARLTNKPLWSPAYITISDLFRQHSGLIVADPIKLICDLHKEYIRHTGTEESLDHFFGWGQILLSDFDDIDKNLADAKKVFGNLRDLHEYDDISYLNKEQMALLQRFFSNFSDQHNSELKRRFLHFWSHFHDIYVSYNQRLESQGLAYEGALYRRVVDSEKIEFKYKTYAFVGFNMVQKVEQALFKRLRQERDAKFYWDYDHAFIDSCNHEAGFFIKKHIQEFPNELDNHDEAIYNHFNKPKELTFISSPTDDAQARFVSDWLLANSRIDDGRDTAIVLCDELLLPRIIHSLPPEVGNVNVTTGYPLSQSPFASLVHSLIMLQTAGLHRYHDRYRVLYINKVLNHPYIKYVSTNTRMVKQMIDEQKLFYLEKETLSAIDEGLALLSADVTDGGNEAVCNLEKLSRWLLDILTRIADNSQQNEDPFFQEGLFKTYKLLNRLHELILAGDLAIDIVTFLRLFTQLTASTTIPFLGEPAKGLQVMGLLETRNLDFKHVLLLSCNEGKMPKGINDTSFIPHAIRKAFDLTTIDHKVSIYSYYFHSLIQRAEDVTILYNNSTEDGQRGEMSRFMLQLMVESNQHIHRESLKSEINLSFAQPSPIAKDGNCMSVLNQLTNLSPTSIIDYIRCPLQFFYHRIAEIEKPEEIDDGESIDNRTFGNIFHRAAELAYKELMAGGNVIRQDTILALLKHPVKLEMIINQAFNEMLFNLKGQGKTPVLNGLQLINRQVILNYLQQLLEIDTKHQHFTILGLEENAYENVTFDTTTGKKTLAIGGIIDRLDMVTGKDGQPQIRVIDYKTGRAPTSQVYSLEELFTNNGMRTKHTHYFFQTLLYSIIVRHSHKLNPGNATVSPALLFIQQSKGEDYDPILFLNRERIDDILPLEQEFRDRLNGLLSEIFDPSHPFEPTENKDMCTHCVYQRLCMM
ncbi:MAG: PD-(D/E)XK nuclease family protein [Prevotella sp.]|nr:PD-(D/E)XK nuclease family protein [Prevotella sp.]